MSNMQSAMSVDLFSRFWSLIGSPVPVVWELAQVRRVAPRARHFRCSLLIGDWSLIFFRSHD